MFFNKIRLDYYIFAAAASEPEASEQGSNPNLYFIYVGKNLDFTFNALHYGNNRLLPQCSAVCRIKMHVRCRCLVFLSMLRFSQRQRKFSGGEVLTIFW